MIFKQFNFDGCLSYIAACSNEFEGIIIDPSHETEPYFQFVKENNLKILYVVDTHTHVDHISLAPDLAGVLGAKTVMHKNTRVQREIGEGIKELYGIEKIIAENAGKRVDIFIDEDYELRTGGLVFRIIFTPGHTQDSMCLVSHDRIYTGDTILIGQCGRTDLPGGSSKDMHDSLFGKLAGLSNDLIVYPAHDYQGNINSSMGYEKVNNVCLNTKRTVEEFDRFLVNLFPPLNAGNGKLQCGLTKGKQTTEGEGSELNPLMKTFCFSMEHYLQQPHEATLIHAEELYENIIGKKKFLIIDVREPEELSITGHIKDAVNIPVGEIAKRTEELPGNLDIAIIIVCESGIRSAHAALYLRAYGYNDVKNLEYGMREWRTKGFPIVYPG
jgi:glyoxylase-like metal-dependent hydrolase (beta-lactamase superfamily II)/rhodanese-related sulfurtransferase